MRISDWSSDVCSSDLERVVPAEWLAEPTPSSDDAMKSLLLRAARSHGVGTARCLADYHRLNIVPSRRLLAELADDGALRPVRSAERRVGQECVSPCTSRCPPSH